MRAFSEIAYRGLKAACDLAYGLVGGNTLFQHSTRVTVSQLSKYASFRDEDARAFMPIDVALDLDRAAQSPVITGYMAKQLGFRLVPEIDEGVMRAPITETDAHRVLSESMDLSRAILDALLDGKVDALERKQIAREGREAIRAIEQVLIRLEDGGSA